MLFGGVGYLLDMFLFLIIALIKIKFVGISQAPFLASEEV